MSKDHLGISSVPIQQWGELYTLEEALNVGTIFKDLNLPFFATEQVMSTASPIANASQSDTIPQEAVNREQLLTKINEVSFFLDDLTLYLDTHENDTQALQLYQEKAKECDELKKQFAQQFYPLTKMCIPSCENSQKFCWLCGPTPWEGACV